MASFTMFKRQFKDINKQLLAQVKRRTLMWMMLIIKFPIVNIKFFKIWYQCCFSINRLDYKCRGRCGVLCWNWNIFNLSLFFPLLDVNTLKKKILELHLTCDKHIWRKCQNWTTWRIFPDAHTYERCVWSFSGSQIFCSALDNVCEKEKERTLDEDWP